MHLNQFSVHYVEELQTRDLDYKLKCEEIQQLTAELESKKKNSKSKTVLDLEIEAYEKSLSELKIKLDSKIDEVKEVNRNRLPKS